MAAIRKTAARTKRQTRVSQVASREPSACGGSGDGQVVSLPVIETRGIDPCLMQAGIAKTDGGPQAFAAVGRAAVDDDGLRAFESRLQFRQAFFHLFLGKTDRPRNVAVSMIGRGTHIEEDRRAPAP